MEAAALLLTVTDVPARKDACEEVTSSRGERKAREVLGARLLSHQMAAAMLLSAPGGPRGQGVSLGTVSGEVTLPWAEDTRSGEGHSLQVRQKKQKVA